MRLDAGTATVRLMPPTSPTSRMWRALRATGTQDPPLQALYLAPPRRAARAASSRLVIPAGTRPCRPGGIGTSRTRRPPPPPWPCTPTSSPLLDIRTAPPHHHHHLPGRAGRCWPGTRTRSPLVGRGACVPSFGFQPYCRQPAVRICCRQLRRLRSRFGFPPPPGGASRPSSLPSRASATRLAVQPRPGPLRVACLSSGVVDASLPDSRCR